MGGPLPQAPVIVTRDNGRHFPVPSLLFSLSQGSPVNTAPAPLSMFLLSSPLLWRRPGRHDRSPPGALLTPPTPSPHPSLPQLCILHDLSEDKLQSPPTPTLPELHTSTVWNLEIKFLFDVPAPFPPSTPPVVGRQRDLKPAGF